MYQCVAGPTVHSRSQKETVSFTPCFSMRLANARASAKGHALASLAMALRLAIRSVMVCSSRIGHRSKSWICITAGAHVPFLRRQAEGWQRARSSNKVNTAPLRTPRLPVDQDAAGWCDCRPRAITTTMHHKFPVISSRSSRDTGILSASHPIDMDQL